jgi:hypothetical protein
MLAPELGRQSVGAATETASGARNLRLFIAIPLRSNESISNCVDTSMGVLSHFLTSETDLMIQNFRLAVGTTLRIELTKLDYNKTATPPMTLAECLTFRVGGQVVIRIWSGR